MSYLPQGASINFSIKKFAKINDFQRHLLQYADVSVSFMMKLTETSAYCNIPLAGWARTINGVRHPECAGSTPSPDGLYIIYIHARKDYKAKHT